MPHPTCRLKTRLSRTREMQRPSTSALWRPRRTRHHMNPLRWIPHLSLLLLLACSKCILIQSAGTLSSQKADKEHGPFYAKKHATPAVAKASPAVNIAAPVTPKAAPESAIGEGVGAPVRYDNEIGPNGEIYCNEIGKGKCLQRAVNFVCVEWTDCVIKPTAMPTHHPVPHPTARPTYMVSSTEFYGFVCISAYIPWI